MRAQFRTWSKHLLILWICCPAAASVFTQDIYWTDEAKASYGLLVNLRVDEALNIIRLQSITFPENRIWVYLEDYAYFLRIFVQEDLREISTYMAASDVRLERLYTLPESNPMSLMVQAQIHLHHCALRLQQGQFLTAASDINKAFKLLKKNQKLYPDDMANLRLYASLKIVFGAIPDQYRWLVSMVTSLSGSIEDGLAELYAILQRSSPNTNIYYRETVLFTALAEGSLNNTPGSGLGLLIRHFGRNPDNKAAQFIMARLLIKTGNNDGAIRVMTQAIQVPGTLPIPFMEFMLGECKLFRGDVDADDHFKNFLVYHKGKHFIKEAHQKLAWHALLTGDRQGYLGHMQQILIKGSATTDEDQQALHEAESHDAPHPILLRARLYFDGGYFDQALPLLTDAFYTELTQHHHRLEFLYRKGRLLQAKKQFAEALHYFGLAISGGQFESYYYACASALQSGIIHEKLGSEGAAVKYYYMCLDMHPANYASSLHQKARMGLNRIEK